MNDDEFRMWLTKYLQQHLGQWMREIDEKMMEPPTIKNWPTRIEVELPCECCGKKIKVPFQAKRFRAKEHVDWPYYIEYMSPAMMASTCPACKHPFRLNRKTPEQRM